MNRSYPAIKFSAGPAQPAGALLILPYSKPDECRYFYEQWSGAQALKVIAVDGGLEPTLAAGLVPDVWIGDGDSIVPTSQIPKSVTQMALPVDKDISDLEFALRWSAQKPFDRAHITGLWGGRPDHSLINHELLTAYASSFSAGLSASEAHCIFVYAHEEGNKRVEVGFPKGTTFSIVALSHNTRVTISGAKWELQNKSFSSKSHGLSNVAVAQSVCMQVTTGSAVMIGPFNED